MTTYEPLQPGGVDDYPVKVGSMLLTLVDPNKGFERAYNRWYERDTTTAAVSSGRTASPAAGGWRPAS